MKEILASSSLSTGALLDKYLVKYRRDLAFKAERREEKSDLHKSMAPLSAILDLVLKPLSPRIKAHDRLGHMIFSAYIRKQFRGKETKREFLKMEAATAEERFVVVVDFTVLHYIKTIFDH